MTTKRFLIPALTILMALSLSIPALAYVGTNEGMAGETVVYYPPVEGESAAAAAPVVPQARSSNTPFFVGAVLAVLMFVGVALYCKAKGNKGY